MKTLILIDGNALIFRAYYATATRMTRSTEGIPTNALYLFASIIMKLLEKKDFDDIIVALDSPGKKIRHQEYENYKANRKEIPLELKQQFEPIKQFLNLSNIKTIEVEGYEADDLIGSLSKDAQKKGYEVHIYTGDRDLLQLIDDNIYIYMMRKGLSEIEIFDKNHLKEVYNIAPKQIIDVKSLMGDTSDNIPGVKGIGEKTAFSLIEKYESLDNIFQNIDNISGKLKEKLQSDKKMAYLSYDLATIFTDLKIDYDLTKVSYQPYDKIALNKFFKQYNIKSLLKYTTEETEDEQFNIKASIVNKVSKQLLSNNSFIYIDLDNDNYHYASLRGIAIANDKLCEYLPAECLNLDFDFIDYLTNCEIKKQVYDLKKSIVSLHKHNINLKGVDFDLLLAAYLLNQNLNNLPEGLFADYQIHIEKLKKQASFEEIVNFSGSIAKAGWKIKNDVLEKIHNIENDELLFKVEQPLAIILAKMEENGVLLDTNLLNKLSVEYNQRIVTLENEIKTIANKDLNINSPKQLADYLYNELKLPCNKKMSTTAEDLKKIASLHPIINKILEYRKYTKLLSTYIDSFNSYKFDDNRIHALFNQSTTMTGRLSSSQPNLQNLSVRDESRMIIRKLIIAPNNYNILSLDYSQIELRILAILSQDETMLNAFNNNIDIHSVTASKIYNLPIEKISKEQRRVAKAVNFGIVYGMSPWGLSEEINVDFETSKKFIETFFITYPKVKDFLNSNIEFCKKNGYVTTMLRRRRKVPEINASMYQVKEFGKRVAMNTPIQGSAADIIKIAMIAVDQLISEEKLDVKLICQIHDELLFEVNEKQQEEIALKIKNVMENVLPNHIKLEVNYSIGHNWLEAK